MSLLVMRSPDVCGERVLSRQRSEAAMASPCDAGPVSRDSMTSSRDQAPADRDASVTVATFRPGHRKSLPSPGEAITRGTLGDDREEEGCRSRHRPRATGTKAEEARVRSRRQRRQEVPPAPAYAA